MAWSIVGVGTVVEAATTAITLTEPAGVADGDLLIACFASRTTATTAVTNTGWTAVNSQNTNNTSATAGSAIASGTMLYQVRAGTPDLSFVVPAGISVIRGQIVAYRGNAVTQGPFSLVPTANAFGVTPANATYSVVREATTATTSAPATPVNIGQSLSGTYTCGQYFLTVNTSGIPASVTIANLSINITGGLPGGDSFEIREVSSAANMIAGSSLAATPLLGTFPFLSSGFGRRYIPLDITSLTRGSAVVLCIHSREQRTGTAPATADIQSVSTLAAAADLQPAFLPGISAAETTNTGTSAVSVTGLTTAQDDDLIVAMAAGGQEATWSSFNATTPSGASGATDTTTAPSATWRERAESVTTTGADTSLGIFDALKTAAGATGNLTVTASIASGHVVIAGAFKIASAGPVNRTLPAVAGSYAVTGTAALLERGREVEAIPGGYALIGADATLTKGGGLWDDQLATMDTWPDVDVLGTAVVAYSLPADAGSYALTGATALLERGREIVADPGTYVIAGTIASLERGREVSAVAGSYALTGTAATFRRAWKATAVSGSYALAGTVASLELGKEVLALPGSYAVSGVTASLEYGREVTGVAGSYALTGVAASLELGREALAVAGSYTLTGTPANLLKVGARAIIGLPGAYALTGAASSLELNREVTADVGSYALTGTAATLTKGAALVHRTLPAVAGSYALTGGAAAATAPSTSQLLSYTPGSDRNDFTGEVGVRLGIGTSDIPFNWIGARRHHANQTGVHTVTVYEWFGDTVVASAAIDYTGVAVGSFAWTAVPATTLLANGYYALLMQVTAFDGQTWCNPGATAFTGIVNVYDCYRVPASGLSTGLPNQQFIGFDLGQGAAGAGATSLEYGREVLGVAGSYALTGTPANLLRVGARAIIGLPGAYALTGAATSLEYGREVLAVGGTYALSGQIVSLEYGREVLGLGGSYVLSGSAASLERGREVLATNGSYALTGLPANLLKPGAYALAALPGSYALTGHAATLLKSELLAAGLISVWNGSAWVDKPAKVWTGAAWAQKPVKHWDGSAWV